MRKFKNSSQHMCLKIRYNILNSNIQNNIMYIRIELYNDIITLL